MELKCTKDKSNEKYRELLKTDWANQFDERKKYALDLALRYNIDVRGFVEPECSAEDILDFIEVFQEERSYLKKIKKKC